MRYRLAYALALVTATLQLSGMYAASTVSAERTPRAVSLSDADRAPDFLRILYPAGRPCCAHVDTAWPVGWYLGERRIARICRGRGGMFSDVSAYRWNGSPLGPQRRTVDGWSYWRHPRGGRVEWDGVGFWNGSARPVLVAAWCG